MGDTIRRHQGDRVERLDRLDRPGITPAALADGRSAGPDAVSSDGTHVWVGESTAGSVSEIDPSSGQITEPITDLGAAPDAISSDGTHVWVTLSGSAGTVLEFQASNDQLIKSTNLDTDVYDVSSDGTDAWVTEQHAGDITELNDSTGGVIQNIANPAGTGGPEGVSSDGTHVWVANYFSTISTVSEITIAPATSVLIPSTGAPLSGSTYLDASASNATSVEFLLVGGSYTLYSPHVVGTATLSLYGWLDSWNTTTVPNGSYTLFSYATGPGGSTASSGVSITVNNVSPPTTSVLIPSKVRRCRRRSDFGRLRLERHQRRVPTRGWRLQPLQPPRGGYGHADLLRMGGHLEYHHRPQRLLRAVLLRHGSGWKHGEFGSQYHGP